MERNFDEELVELRDKLVTMASHASASVTNAIQALVNRDDRLARRVKDEDAILDRLEMEVDEMAVQLLAKAPLASDLRLLTIAMKVSQNLERVGDEATTISRRVLALNREPQLRPPEDLSGIAAMALAMLKRARESFIAQNSEKASEVIPQDEGINAFHRNLEKELTDLMIRDSASVRRCLNLIVISKSLERIADHATNIAEQVVYLCEARDIRHGAEQA